MEGRLNDSQMMLLEQVTYLTPINIKNYLLKSY